MTISKDLLRKQHDHITRSGDSALTISLGVSLLFALDNSEKFNSQEIRGLVTGIILLGFLFLIFKNNYYSTLYESRLVNENKRDVYREL